MGSANVRRPLPVQLNLAVDIDEPLGRSKKVFPKVSGESWDRKVVDGEQTEAVAQGAKAVEARAEFLEVVMSREDLMRDGGKGGSVSLYSGVQFAHLDSRDPPHLVVEIC